MRNANARETDARVATVTDRSLLDRFRQGEQDAATQLYLRYSSRLLSWASLRTSTAYTARFDEEDVVQSVFRTFFRRVNQGLYDVPPGEELWQLLLVIALNKIRKMVAYHRAEKRDVEKTELSVALEVLGRRAQSDDETSLQVLQLVVDELLGNLPATDRAMVELRIEGHTTDEIVEYTGRSKRTTERLLRRFRLRLSDQLDAGSESPTPEPPT